MKMMYLVAAAALAMTSVTVPTGRILTFNGLSGKSTLQDVRKKFPKALVKNYCRNGETIQKSADGPYRCETLALNNYLLAGYNFELFFWFYESGSLKGISLRWPDSKSASGLSEGEIKNAYYSILDQIVAKYGTYCKRPPCELIGNTCAEWQMDGNTIWHAGGERIELEANTTSMAMKGVTLSYKFADRSSFERF
jgi:hypothetical protein